MKLLVLFGSQSDSSVYNPLIEKLSDSHEVSFDIISAHRDPSRLSRRLSLNDFEVVLAGAGLAAHLPGVIASQTDRPVLGIPVAAHFAGLDAFASIVQMPFCVPVLSTAPGREFQYLEFLEQFSVKKFDALNLVVTDQQLRRSEVAIEIERMKLYSIEHNVELVLTDRSSLEFINIQVVGLDQEIDFEDSTVYLPILSKDQKKDPIMFLDFFNLALKGGVWTGVNNGRNGIKIIQKFKNSLNRRS